MKKMVCEICGSQSFKKENGVFVCQECGTEYSAEDAKKLLTEIQGGSVPEKKEQAKKEENANLEKVKLEYDLLCWHNFYEKCHELENSFEIKDDSLKRCSDIASVEYEGDIAYREINYDDSNHAYFTDNVYPKLKEKYLFRKTELLPLYEKAKRKADDDESQSVAARNAKVLKRNREIIAAIIALSVVIIPFIVLCFVGHLTILGSLLAVALVGLDVFLFSGRDSCVSVKQFASYDEWIVENIDEYEGFKNHVSEKEKAFLDVVKAEEKGILEGRKELVEIRNNLLKEIPIPEKYSDEYHINGLLALVLDCRADTLKEAINLFETETYRNTVVNSLNVLNLNIIQLNKNISMLRDDVGKIRDSVYQGFSILIKQNDQISRQLDSIRFDTRYLMLDSLFSDN